MFAFEWNAAFLLVDILGNPAGGNVPEFHNRLYRDRKRYADRIRSLLIYRYGHGLQQSFRAIGVSDFQWGHWRSVPHSQRDQSVSRTGKFRCVYSYGEWSGLREWRRHLLERIACSDDIRQRD
jgi:hypothetical protein